MSVPPRMTAPRVVAVSGSSPRIVRAVTVLPLPDSPTMASTSPARTSSETSLDGDDVSGVGREGDIEVADVDREFLRTPSLHLPDLETGGRLRRGHRIRRRRARAGATPSPQARVGEVVEALADERDAQHDEHDREPGEDRGPPDAARHVADRLVEVVAPLGGRRRLDAEARGSRGRRASGSPPTR